VPILSHVPRTEAELRITAEKENSRYGMLFIYTGTLKVSNEKTDVDSGAEISDIESYRTCSPEKYAMNREGLHSLSDSKHQTTDTPILKRTGHSGHS
jgi:hypothetical protein